MRRAVLNKELVRVVNDAAVAAAAAVRDADNPAPVDQHPLSKLVPAPPNPQRARIFPLVRPETAKAHEWPCIVYVSVGGAPIMAYEGHDPRPAIRVDVLSKGYLEAHDIQGKVVEVVSQAGILAEAPDSPTDIYDEEESIFRVSTTLVLGHG